MAEAEAAKAGEGEAKSAGKGGMLGIVLGVAVLVGAGAGIGMYVPKLLRPHQAEDGHQAQPHDEGVEHAREVPLGDLITNISGSEGRRYVKVSCAIWTDAEDAKLIVGEGGGEGAIQVKKLLQMALEEQLKRYDMADLSGRGAISMLSQDFMVVLEGALHQHFSSRPKDHRFVRKVILNNLLVQ